MSDNESFVHSKPPTGFGEFGPEDDQLHPEHNKGVTSDALTETQYFGFSVPEHRIHGLGYMWHHPNLGIVSGGIGAWQGFKELQTSCELFDMRSYMGDSVVRDGLTFQMENGYSVEVIEPMRRFRVRYDDPNRSNAVDITYTAVSEPLMLPNRRHFEQIMRTHGSIHLRGRRYDVDGFNVRDRSWAEARSEAPAALPPIAWYTGVFGDDLAFNCVCSEDPQRDVEWKGVFPSMTAEAAFRGGWILKGGQRLRVVSASSVIRRSRPFFQPREVQLSLTDESGGQHSLSGVVRASSPVNLWPNVQVVVCLTEWSWDDRKGYGDTQDCMWNDFIYALSAEDRPSGRPGL